jgi:hypothetical protein
MKISVGSLFLLVSGITLFSACGKAGYAASMPQELAADYGYAMNVAGRSRGTAVYEDAEIPQSDNFFAELSAGRKLIKRAELRIRVEDIAATEKPLIELMEKYGAWPASTGIYENSRDYSIRVPSGFYDAMLAELAGMGRLLRRTENAEDVTLRYYDLESRLATKRELLKTYQGYLGRSSNIDEIMTVESRIADLQQEIDLTGTQFRNLANLIDYSTINLGIAGPVSVSSHSEATLGEKLKELFGAFGAAASTTLVVLLGIIIYGVPLVLVIILFFWVLFGRIGLLKKLLYLAAGKKINRTSE